MRASSWMPGTAFVRGVRFPAEGAMTLRSVMGVKAKEGSVLIELSAGVVGAVVLAVVRSALSKQMASARLEPKSSSNSLQRDSSARAASEITIDASKVRRQSRIMLVSPAGFAPRTWSRA